LNAQAVRDRSRSGFPATFEPSSPARFRVAYLQRDRELLARGPRPVWGAGHSVRAGLRAGGRSVRTEFGHAGPIPGRFRTRLLRAPNDRESPRPPGRKPRQRRGRPATASD
jgi:hypothetical protein